MQKYISYGSDEHYSDIIFNDILIDEPSVTVHEIGTSASYPGDKKVFVRDSFYMHIVKSGYGYFMNEKVSIGSGYLMVPGEYCVFAASNSDPWKQTWIQIDGNGAKELLEKSGFPIKNHIFTHSSAVKMAEILHNAVYDNYTDYDINLKFSSILYEILSLHRHATVPKDSLLNMTKSDKYIYTTIKYIKENYQNDITTADVANVVNLSPNHLCKIFKKATDFTVKNYIIRQRIMAAEKLLMDTALNITEISNSVGFYDSMYFSQVFRQYSGYTPSQFRERYKKTMKKK